MKKALLLVNVGTPDKPEVSYVRKYLFEFLNDRRVIDLPWLPQKLLVNGIIVPFRAPKSTRLYRQLWTGEGSPLLVNLNKLVDDLQFMLSRNYKVYGAARYGNPSLNEVLQEIKDNHHEEITVLPLYPHYASSTTGSVHEYIMRRIRKWNVMPRLHFIDQFYSHPGFIEAYVNRIKSYGPEDYDYVLFSYHGLPVRQINKVHPDVEYTSCQCAKEMPEHGKFCYKATCYETTRILAEQLTLHENEYSTAFQSRLNNKWLEPFSDRVIKDLGKKGIKKLLVVAPAFVSDCLETTIEIGYEYDILFRKNGGEELILVESLNDFDDWVNIIPKIIKDK